MAVAVDFFLTAFDPSDLPGASIDPLGFDRGYTFLADKILPGLTNVANRPRYFGMLCAGIALADVDSAAPIRRVHDGRRDAVQRLERLWALANVLAAGENLSAQGIRGIRYVSDEAGRLARAGGRNASARFKLLSRQGPYGVLGIYGAVAEGFALIADRKTFTLSPDGDALARAFIEETEMPPVIQRAVREDTEVSLAALTAWGARSHISASPVTQEARQLAEALHRDSIRSRCARRLRAARRHPGAGLSQPFWARQVHPRAWRQTSFAFFQELTQQLQPHVRPPYTGVAAARVDSSERNRVSTINKMPERSISPQSHQAW